MEHKEPEELVREIEEKEIKILDILKELKNPLTGDFYYSISSVNCWVIELHITYNLSYNL